jgi:folylpolyglutamate synthase/dihydropteroate synthase
MLASLKEVSDGIIVTASKHAKAVEPTELAETALKAGFKDVERKETSGEALEKALKQEKPVCVCGSVYLVGELITYT